MPNITSPAVNDVFLAARVLTRRYAERRDLLIHDAEVEAFRADRMTELVSALAHGRTLEDAAATMAQIGETIIRSYPVLGEPLADVAEAQRLVREGRIIL